MLVRGLIHVIHLDVGELEMPCRIYIYASTESCTNSMPIEWRQEYFNQCLFGNISFSADMPKQSYVGFVVIDGNKASCDFDIWARGSNQPLFYVKRAFVFDVPVRCEINEVSEEALADLSAHTYIPSVAKVEKNMLIMPVIKSIFDFVTTSGSSFTVEVTEPIASLVLDENGDLKRFDCFTLICGRKMKRFAWTDVCKLELTLDRHGKPQQHPSVYSRNIWASRTKLVLSCRIQIFD